MEYEYTTSFFDVQESLFNSLKGRFCPQNVMQIFIRNESECDLNSLKLKYQIKKYKCQLRKIVSFIGPKLILDHTPINSIENQLKVMLSIENCFFKYNHDLIPYTVKTAREIQLTSDDLKIVNIINSPRPSFSIRRYDYINVGNYKIRLAFDEYEHYTKGVMYSVHIELECNEFCNEARETFISFIKDTIFPLDELLNDISLTPFNIFHFSQTEVARPFTTVLNSDIVYKKFSNKLDGERAYGLLYSQGLFFSYSGGLGSIKKKLPLKQLYHVTVEVMSFDLAIIIDVNKIVRYRHNFNMDIASSVIMFEYTPIEYPVSIMESLEFMKDSLSNLIECNRYFDNLQDLEAYTCPYPVDGRLAFSDNMIVKLKQNHTIELQFKLNSLIMEMLEKKEYTTKTGKIRKKSDLNPALSKILKGTFYTIDVIRQIPISNLNRFFHHFYTREGIQFIKAFEKIPINLNGISNIYEFFNQLKVSKDGNVLNNLQLVEFKFERNCGYGSLTFNRFRHDKYIADDVNKIKLIIE
ncbi:MAG: hypothetical protein ACRYGG_14805 [Janthinobacterium lividum]